MGSDGISRDWDAVVVGAGVGGLYAALRLKQMGLSVLGLEMADGVGGVWLHNRYPGARVDIESVDYCYYFSDELYNDWKWSERFASQGELLRYLNHVADRFDIRRHFRFETALDQAVWHPEEARYQLTTDRGESLTCRYLIMATGNLSAARDPDFPGLSDFTGEWVQASHWPDRDVPIAGRRIAVIGTGSSGVQIVTAVAEQAEQLYVFQRTPNYSVPAHNRPRTDAEQEHIDVAARRAHLLTTAGGFIRGYPTDRTHLEFSEEERRFRIERQWGSGGPAFNAIFADQGTDERANTLVADFVRDRIREQVRDPATAELLCPHDHPIGTRRLCVDTGYYEKFNRPNVTLVDVAASPIERITATGIQTADAHYEVDLIVFALGFHAFRGAIDQIDIRNEQGAHPTDRWSRGPQTLLGLMTAGFPNFFFLTGPGSPSVLANMMLMNEEHVNFMADLIAHAEANGHATIEPSPQAERAWTAHVAEAAGKLLRLGVKNYMVHVNADDGSRVFMPYTGGLHTFVQKCREIADRSYEGFLFDGEPSGSDALVREQQA